MSEITSSTIESIGKILSRAGYNLEFTSEDEPQEAFKLRLKLSSMLIEQAKKLISEHLEDSSETS